MQIDVNLRHSIHIQLVLAVMHMFLLLHVIRHRARGEVHTMKFLLLVSRLVLTYPIVACTRGALDQSVITLQ
jgi:hypothetical protein